MTAMYRYCVAALAAIVVLTATPMGRAQDTKTLFREPVMSRDHIVFAYAGDLWRVDRSGGRAVRLTSGIGEESHPFISPDGQWVAFTGDYDGNTDVFVMPILGGSPKRLTWHPAGSLAVGWTPDGKVMFASTRNSYANFLRLFTIDPIDGVMPEEIPLPSAERGTMNAAGTHIAYEPLVQWQQAFKRYQGGQQDKIWIARLSDSSVERIPHVNSSDRYPTWVGDMIYFVSDRDSTNFDYRLWVYDTGSGDVKLAYDPKGRDIKSIAAGPDGQIIFEEFGSIHIFDPASGKARAVEITVDADIVAERPRYAKVGGLIQNAHISPTGQRAVFEARGDILTVPAEKGDIRNITRSTGVVERDPAWSPDGQSIAYLSEATGEYALHIRDQKGFDAERIITLPPMFYYAPIWSPDSQKIALRDQGDVLWVVDLGADTPTAQRIDKNPLPFGDVLNVSWSPASDLIAYAKQGSNLLRAIMIHDLKTGETHRVTDGLSDARHPVFGQDGKYLYFTASTNIAETISWADMSGLGRNTSRQVYALVLASDTPSPLAHESDDEPEDTSKPKPSNDTDTPATTNADPDTEPAKPSTRVDYAGIMHRIVRLPALDTTISSLQVGVKGALFATEQHFAPGAPPTLTVHRFDAKSRRFKRVAEGLADLQLSHDGKSALVRRGRNNWSIAEASALGKPGKTLKTGAMQIRVEPQVEWAQMFGEVWRGERDFFYDANLHGLDLDWARATYGPYVASVRHRSDLTYVFNEMLGQLTIGHMFVRGGDQASTERVKGGLLGADYVVDNNRYRIAKIYRGDAWAANRTGPLNAPGLNVKAGDYLLAVDGIDLTAETNIFAAFEATAGKHIRITIADTAEGENSREVMVTPTANERGIRNADWIEANRKKVDALSDGKLAYIYMPNTAGPGFASFNRYFYAQTDKQGAVLDERFNGGGLLSDYVAQTFKKDLLAKIFFRYGDTTIPVPAGAIYGPKAMIINEMAGSGGDALPWFFKKAGVGKLFGKKTWGGLVAAQGLPTLIDGGTVRAPDAAVFNLKGDWEIENYGTTPDVVVEWDPAAWRRGEDPQLEATVAHLMEELKRNPPKQYPVPKPPNYFKRP